MLLVSFVISELQVVAFLFTEGVVARPHSLHSRTPCTVCSLHRFCYPAPRTGITRHLWRVATCRSQASNNSRPLESYGAPPVAWGQNAREIELLNQIGMWNVEFYSSLFLLICIMYVLEWNACWVVYCMCRSDVGSVASTKSTIIKM